MKGWLRKICALIAPVLGTLTGCYMGNWNDGTSTGYVGVFDTERDYSHSAVFIHGSIYEKSTTQQLSGIRMTLMNEGKVVMSGTADKLYYFAINPWNTNLKSNFILKVEEVENQYVPQELDLEVGKMPYSTNVNIFMEKKMK